MVEESQKLKIIFENADGTKEDFMQVIHEIDQERQPIMDLFISMKAKIY